MAERRRARIPIPPEYKERRLNHHARVPVAPSFAHGWLVFKTGGERRRLAPIPEGWAVGSTGDLRGWCERALPVMEIRGPLGGPRGVHARGSS